MAIRLYVTAALGGGPLTLDRDQSHYVANVMRAKVGDELLLFNGRDGEWRARISVAAKNGVQLQGLDQTRPQDQAVDLWLLAAPIKKDRLDLMVEKAVELGVSALWPTITRRTMVSRVNGERLAAQMVEAAEQCERLTVPDLHDPQSLPDIVADWPSDRPLIYLDERGAAPPIAQALGDIPAGPLAVLVGPEGGFAPEERDLLLRQPWTRPVSLGGRILRAETAAIAALAVIQAVWGDW